MPIVIPTLKEKESLRGVASEESASRENFFIFCLIEVFSDKGLPIFFFLTSQL